MKAAKTDLTDLASWMLNRPGTDRFILAIAGPPGSGKSTVAAQLVDRLNLALPDCAALLPMDGFHFDDMLLDQLGRQSRKGAPDTFDVGGLVNMIVRLRSNDEGEILVPVFDRNLEIARAGARVIAPNARFVVVEGNYLLLKTEPWNRLADVFDASVMLRTPKDVLRERLTKRWVDLGLPEDEVQKKVEENDLPNGFTVISQSKSPDFEMGN